MKMLDAETRSCYSGPVCAIYSNPDVCHQPAPLPLSCPPSSLPHHSILAAHSLQDSSCLAEELMAVLMCVDVTTVS